MGFYTCNVLETITEVPQIIDGEYDTVRIQERISEKKFAGYIEGLLEIYDPAQDFLVTGWIEADNRNAQAQCEQLAENFFKTQSVGLTKYLDCAKIFFVHKGQIPSEWARRLGFRVQRMHRSGPMTSLAFILIYQPAKSSINASRLQKIVPEPISTLQEYSQADEVEDYGRGRQLNRQLSGPQTPDILSERPLSRGASQSMMDVEPSYQSESRPRSFKAPTFVLQPEFMNMDSNAQSNTFQSAQDSRRSRQSEQRGRVPAFPQGMQDPYNEGMYEEEVNYGENFQQQQQYNQPRSFSRGFSREQSNENSRGSNRQSFHKWQNQGTYKKFTENPRPQPVRNVPTVRTPTKSPSANEPNPFYLEYLKNKSRSQALGSSPIAQKYLGRSPNVGNQQNFQRSGYSSQNVGGGNFNKYQTSQNPSSQRFSRPQNENRGGFVYSNLMNKPYSQNYPPKKQW